MFGRHTIEYIDIDKERREREANAKAEIVKEEMQAKNFIEILELSKASDNEILQKYKFTLWRDLSIPVRYYLLNRFKINLFTRGECTAVGHNATFYEPVGKTLEQIIKTKKQEPKSELSFSERIDYTKTKAILKNKINALEKIRNLLIGESFSNPETRETKRAEILAIIDEVRDGE